MNVVLLHPAAAPGRPLYLLAAAGLFSIASALEREGHRVTIVNQALEEALSPDYCLEDDPVIRDAEVVGISLQWHEHSYGAVQLAKAVRRSNPQAVLVMGGITASVFAAELIGFCSELDALFTGEAEESLSAVLADLRQYDPAARRKRIAEVAGPTRIVPCGGFRSGVHRALSYAAALRCMVHRHEYLKCDIHAFNPKRYWNSLWLKTGCGCPFTCSFCGGGRTARSGAGFSTKVWIRPAERLAADMADLAAAGVHQVNVTQDLALAPAGYLRSLRKHLTARGVRVGVYMEAWQCPDPDWLRQFAATFDVAFSTVVLSPLSGDEQVRFANGKRYTNEQLFAAAGALDETGIRWEAFFAAGLPFAGSEATGRTIALAEALQSRYSPAVVATSGITLDPACPMAAEPERFGVQPHLRTFDAYYSRARARAESLPYPRYGYDAGDEGGRLADELKTWQAGPGGRSLAQNWLLGLTPFLGDLQTGRGAP